jgi:hypothetical protein
MLGRVEHVAVAEQLEPCAPWVLHHEEGYPISDAEVPDLSYDIYAFSNRGPLRDAQARAMDTIDLATLKNRLQVS